MPITFKIIYTCESIHNAIAEEVLSNSHKYFTFDSQFVFFHIYDHLSIPSLVHLFVQIPMMF